VHRTLETLCRISEARKVTVLHGSARYDANLTPHQHVVYVVCRHFWVCVDKRRKAARFDLRQMADDRVSAVQFVRFPLGGLDAAEFLALANAGNVAIAVDHPKMQVRAQIDGPLAHILSEDLVD